MNILIIGGSRFVGPLIVNKLLIKSHSVTIFNRGKQKPDYKNGVKFIRGNRNNGFDIKDYFDVVIDTCAYNGLQTKTAMNELDFDFYINFGTAASYKKTNKFPLTEKSELGTWSLWGEDNKYATIRPVYILGKNNYVDREHFIYSRIKNNVPLVLPGNGQALIQFVFAEDVANSIALLAEKKIVGAFNCCGDEVITLNELVKIMGDISGKKPVIKFNPNTDGEKHNEKEFPFANENFYRTNTKLRNLGIKFTPLIKGLRNDYENYYKHVI